MRRPPAPRIFQLSLNRRSHGGITKCAQFVTSLITRFFPDSIDVLSPEEGLVDGPKPIFFTTSNNNIHEFLCGTACGLPLLFRSLQNNYMSCSEATHGFGAQQCKLLFELSAPYPLMRYSGIVVRDKAAVVRLRKQIGDIGIIM